MLSNKNKNIFTFLGKVILIALLIIFIVRTFFIESYTVSSPQMETALLRGDDVFVNKTAYGVRMPITPLTVPFVGSYSSLIQLPYSRLFTSKVRQNDIVLFNNPIEKSKPLDKRELLLSRCIVLPGDTIELKDGVYFIDDKPYVFSPDLMDEYEFMTINQEVIKRVIKEQSIPFRNTKQTSDSTITIQLNRYEVFILNQNLPRSLAIVHKYKEAINYKFVVPEKGQTIVLNEFNASIYKQVILNEQGNKAFITKDHKLILDGREREHYTFGDDYYWLLSDNTNESYDSRTFGFIPFSHIIGKVSYIYYSSYKGNIRKERCFSNVH